MKPKQTPHSPLAMAIVLCASAWGCAADEVPHTQVMVRVVLDGSLVPEPFEVRVRVWRGRYGEEVRDCVIGRDAWQPLRENHLIEVPVVPTEGHESGEFTIQADAYHSPDQWIASQRAIVSFIPDELRGATLLLSASCAERSDATLCGDFETCVDGRCAGACITPGPVGERGSYADCSGATNMCSRLPTKTIRDGLVVEMFCDASRLCFCRDPEGCIDPGDAECCRTPIVCAEDGAACLFRPPVLSDGEPRCPEDLQLCPDGSGCVQPGRAASCCGAPGSCRGE